MLKKILLAVAALLAVFVAIVATRPDTFEVKRSLHINAPAAVVYAQVADFRAWAAWSPWDKLDPAMKRTYAGAETGVGATYAWEGNDKVGKGSMAITDARAPEHLGLDLHFITPFETHNRTDFDFAADDTGTTVTWLMSGKNNFGSKLFSLVMDMDKLVGKDFEDGLAGMKLAAEKAQADALARQQAEAAAAAAAAPEPTDAGVEGSDAGTP